MLISTQSMLMLEEILLYSGCSGIRTEQHSCLYVPLSWATWQIKEADPYITKFILKIVGSYFETAHCLVSAILTSFEV